MLNDAELADIRAEMEASFPAVAKVQRKTVSSDGAGGETETVSVVGTYACRVEEYRTGKEQDSGDRPTSTTPYVVRLPWDADVRAADRLLIDDTFVLEVESPANIKSERLLLNVSCIRRGG